MNELESAKAAAREEIDQRSRDDRQAVEVGIAAARDRLAERASEIRDLAAGSASRPDSTVAFTESDLSRPEPASHPEPPSFATNLVDEESAVYETHVSFASEMPIESELPPFDAELPPFDPELFFE